MTGFPENETKPALSLFSLTLYSSGSYFGLWLALASVFLSLGFLFCALEVTAFNLLLEWLSISIGVRPTDLPSTSMMMDASGAGGGGTILLILFLRVSLAGFKIPPNLGKKEIRSLLRESGSGFLVRSKEIPRA